MTDPTLEYGTMDVSIKKITPSEAEKILENNHVNRNIRPTLVAAYRRDMNQGKWRFTGEPIQFSRSGALLNGQHRLTALAGSRAKRVQDGIDFLVVSGLPDDAQSLMDQGAPRTIADALTIQYGAIKNLTLTSSVARWLTVAPRVTSEFSPNTIRIKASTSEVLETFRKYGTELVEAAQIATAMRKLIPGSPTAHAYSWIQLSRVDKEAANEFYKAMADMEWAWPEDPRKAALRRLQIMVADQDYRTTIESAVSVVSLVTRAWNMWRKGESAQTILIRSRSGVIAPVKPL